MEGKDGKKKESIDEILSDLNGLLNKMPSILDGIRMPEIKPAEFAVPAPALKPAAEVPAPAPEPETEIPLPVFNADKTVVLENFSGLQEGESVPAQAPAPSEGLTIESFDRPAEAAKAEAGGLVPQSLGDFMFGEGAEDQKAEAAAAPKASAESFEPAQEQPLAQEPVVQAADLSMSPLTPAEDRSEAAFSPAGEVSPEAADLSPEPQPEARAEAPAELRPRGVYENTRDFGVPDIDALMQLSQDEILGRPEKQPVAQAEPQLEQQPEQQPEPVLETAVPAAATEEPSVNELAEFEMQLKAAGEQGGEMENKSGDEKQEKPAEETLTEAAAPVPDAAPETGFEALTIEPETSAQPEVLPEPAPQPETPGEFNLNPVTPELQAEPAPQPDTSGEVNLNPAASELYGEPAPQPETPGEFNLNPVTPELQGEPAAQPELSEGIDFGAASQSENTIQLEPGRLPEAQPEPAAQGETPGEPELSVGRPTEKNFGAEPEQGLAMESASSVFSGQQGQSSGDETLVVPPPSASRDEDKTAIYEPGSAPGSTSRSKAEDLDILAGKPVPEGIPAERVRAVMFLYAPEDRALCASFLAELDAICLKSSTKPMFIRRAGVKECASDMNANYILQMATDSGAIGLVCAGAIPQEKIYEVENVFTSSGGFFRHYDSSSFNHSTVLDLVSDLILRV